MYSIIKKKPLVITWHEVWGEYWKTLGIIGWFGIHIERVVSHLGNYSICVSDLTQKRLRCLLNKKIKSEVIENWIDFEEAINLEWAFDHKLRLQNLIKGLG